MKHNILRLFVLSLSIFSFCSCGKEFLKTEPTDRISDQLAWESQDMTDLYINNFYAYLDRYGQFGSLQFNGSFTEGLTNTLKYGTVFTDSNNYVFYPDRMTPQSNLLGIWSDAYTHIRRINEFLDSQKKLSHYSDEINSRYEAQARFFRAFVYFQLAKRHGGVILYTDLNFEKDKNRSTEEETWNLIEKDLDYAIENLPDEWDSANSGRITSTMAWAFKARAMLYAQRWEKAVEACNVVIDSDKYRLTDDYDDCWRGNNSEAIIQFTYASTQGLSHSTDKWYVPYGDWLAVGESDEGGYATPTQEMVEEYEDASGNPVDWSAWHTGEIVSERPPYESLEPRFAKTILYNGCTWKGNTMDITEAGQHGRFLTFKSAQVAQGRTTTGYYLRKLLDETNTSFLSYGSNTPWVEMRLAEIYLIRAEAYYHLNKPGYALSDVNVIRGRADLPPKTGLTGDNLFKAIRHEKQIEFAYEGQLYWDMRRWRLADKEWNNYRVHGIKPIGAAGSYSYQYVDADLQDRKFLAKTYVLPVPASETNNNSAIEQYDEWK